MNKNFIIIIVVLVPGEFNLKVSTEKPFTLLGPARFFTFPSLGPTHLRRTITCPMSLVDDAYVYMYTYNNIMNNESKSQSLSKAFQEHSNFFFNIQVTKFYWLCSSFFFFLQNLLNFFIKNSDHNPAVTLNFLSLTHTRTQYKKFFKRISSIYCPLEKKVLTI